MADQLPGWTDGLAKAAILEFVRSVTEPGELFVPVSERVAAFDLDGTLCCEKPMSPQADFLLRRWQEIALAHPGKARQQPWKAVAEGDREWLAGILGHVPGLTRGVAEAYDGTTVEAFECPRTLRLMMTATLMVRMQVQEKAPPVVFRRGFGVRGGGLVVSLP